MVQEFHVLRCFSCQTFQVQQVKKSKKWTCKVCGEKQSLIKEFGRGAAADCRRHVQKLNALRGQMQEVSTERLMTQWDEEEKYDSEDVHESLDQTCISEQEVTHVSRWTKYTDQTVKDEDEYAENISTERQQFRSQETRKRRKSSNLKSFGGANDSCEDEESRTVSSRFKRRPYLPLQHDGKFRSSWNKACASRYSSCDKSDDVNLCISTNLPSSCQADCGYPTACSSSTYIAEKHRNKQQYNNTSDKPQTLVVTKNGLLCSSVSSHQNFGESKTEKKDSKWSKFLTIVPAQQDEEEPEYQDQNSSRYDNTVMPFSPGVDSEDRRYPHDEKNHGCCVLDRQKSVSNICVNKGLSTTNSQMSMHPSLGNAVCKPPPLAKTPGFSLNSLFSTDEDFDDTI